MKVVQDSAPDPYEGDLPDLAAVAQGRAGREGAEFDAQALEWLVQAGGSILQRGGEIGGVSVDAIIRGGNDMAFTVLAHGNIDRDGTRPGLRRTDTVRKAGDSAYLLHSIVHAPPVLIVTSDIPKESGRNKQAARLLAMHREVIFDVLSPEDLASFHRLQRYLQTESIPVEPEPAAWRELPVDQLSFDLWRPHA
jgi:hypothetical protein